MPPSRHSAVTATVCTYAGVRVVRLYASRIAVAPSDIQSILRLNCAPDLTCHLRHVRIWQRDLSSHECREKRRATADGEPLEHRFVDGRTESAALVTLPTSFRLFSKARGVGHSAAFHISMRKLSIRRNSSFYLDDFGDALLPIGKHERRWWPSSLRQGRA